MRPGVVPPHPLRVAAVAGGLALTSMLGGSCAPSDGSIEIAWSVINHEAETLYPDGALPDLCDLSGVFSVADGGRRVVNARLRFELEICDPSCASGCDDPACQVVEPHQFACNTSRGALIVPASEDQPYRFTSQIAAEIAGDPACTCRLSSACAALPGPRDRAVRGGLVTDLQVYQIVLDVALGVPTEEGEFGSAIDLTPCCELPATCS